MPPPSARQPPVCPPPAALLPVYLDRKNLRDGRHAQLLNIKVLEKIACKSPAPQQRHRAVFGCRVFYAAALKSKGRASVC
ncbi:hypothetical protein E2C01_050867 [Portunus trituberculatus]|uniref:Uncharacterized protein n=1 Tax=Portunus trituberculatus TaxID=210409 RepID=A0A5B7GA41_PORTR|nr:hypothetical protein [Portunus trituberculatus]